MPFALRLDHPGTGLKLLCLADIHLGRQPARIPAAVSAQIPARELGPAGAWARAVDYAIAQGVEAVLLAGDVVEQEDDFHEAFVDLRHGVDRLAAAGIAVIGVTGNHDVRVLPRLAEAIPAFRLLGRGGHWEATVVDNTAGESVQIVGWSFPEARVTTSPLATALPERAPGPTIGLLHCDRDQPGSRYAPVTTLELEQAAVDAWLLGHIHKPDPLAGDRPMGYLGSLTGLDPGETGAHGAWLLHVGDAGRLAIEPVPLAVLRWYEVTVAVDGIAAAEDVHGRIALALDEQHAAVAAGEHRPLAVGVRLRLTGRTDLRAAIERSLTADDPRRAPVERDGIVYFVHDWQLALAPAIDLDAAARGTDPVALLARKLLLLEGDDSRERRALIAAARDRLDAVPRRRPYNSLGAAPPTDEQIATLLARAARRALDDLLHQREGAT